jgi:hypothetical protein
MLDAGSPFRTSTTLSRFGRYVDLGKPYAEWPHMTTYPLDFHKRSEQKWALRAQASSASSENSLQAAPVGSSQRGGRRSGQGGRIKLQALVAEAS